MSYSAFDTNGDGWADVYGADTDYDGDIEYYEVDSNQDGYVDGLMVDSNNDGVIDTFGLDSNQNGYYESIGVDQNDDGYLDVIVQDFNENGVADVAEQPQSSERDFPLLTGEIGKPNLTGVDALVVQLAGETGRAVWGPSDSDNDGWSDNNDYHPGDPYRH